ncbi:ndufa8 [Mactra antiquata]
MAVKTQYLPSYEELHVPELKLSFPALRAASHYLGYFCDNQCKEFMLCRSENRDDPRPCINEGKEVTSCGLDFFNKLKSSPCASSFTSYWKCLDNAEYMEFRYCRQFQKVFDQCMEEHLNMKKPEPGHFTKIRLHDSPRPKVEVELPEPIPVIKPMATEPKTKVYNTQGWSN